MKLYVAYYFWIQKPEEPPEDISAEQHAGMPEIIGPIIDSAELDFEGDLPTLLPLQGELAQRISAVRVCIISAIRLPLTEGGPNLAVPQLLIPRPGGRLQ